jgi:hypothetical protein
MADEHASPRKKARTGDPALVPNEEAKVQAIAKALGPELDPAVPLGPMTTEAADGKLFIKDANSGRAKTVTFAPGPVSIFNGDGKLQLIFQAGVNDTEHPHHAQLLELFKACGGGNKKDFPIGQLWKDVASAKSMFPPKAPNLSKLRKSAQDQRLEAIAADFAQNHVNLDGTPEGLKNKMLMCPSTICIRRKDDGEPMLTLTVTYRYCSEQADRADSDGFKLTPKMAEYLDQNANMAIDTGKDTHVSTPMGTKLSMQELIELPWIVTGSGTEFLKIYAAATVAIPSVMASHKFGRFTLSGFINKLRLYGVVGGGDASEGAAVDQGKVTDVYASIYGN